MARLTMKQDLKLHTYDTSKKLTMTIFRHILKISQISRHFSAKPGEKPIQVCILGAETPMGKALALLVKQNPTISGLHLQGAGNIELMALDLNHCDTRCRVKAYSDSDSVANSTKCAHIVVMLGLNYSITKLSLGKLVMAEGPRVMKLAETCAKYSPKAIVLVAVTPVSVTLPMVSEVFKQTDWYHPGRLIGSAVLPHLKACALAGHYQTLDPQMVHVPIIGGPDVDCAIPLFSDTVPVGISQKESEKLFEKFRDEMLHPCMRHAVGLNRMITSIAMGLNGDPTANLVGFVRTNLISSCKYLVCTVRMGKTAISHNYGLQTLRKRDLMFFEETCIELKNREFMACQFLYREDKCALPEFMVKEIEREKIDKLGVIR